MFFPAFSMIFSLLISCATSPETEEQVAVNPEPQEVEQPAQDQVAAPAPSEAESTTDVIQPAAEESFTVSEEVFSETFEDIRVLIDELNAIVREENYGKWLKYLTDEYIDHFSSPEVLIENSEQPLLKKYNIKLSTLKDYFKYVVVPSRSDARLDDLVFIDNEHVKAIMIFDDKRTILYQLKKVDGGWKIGL